MSTIKKYQCIKQVHAEPMPYGSFRQHVKKVNHVGTIDPMEPGYHVIYSKGTADEYHSWSPKAAFEESYIEIPESRSDSIRAGMKAHAGKLS